MKASDRRLSQTDWLEAERVFAGGPVAFDPCTEKDNPAGALAFCALPQNGLDANWRQVAICALDRHQLGAKVRPVTRLNPPWSDRLVWDFAAGFYAREEHYVIAWSAVDFTAAWWRNLCRIASFRCDLFKRPKCPDPKTGKLMDVGRSGAGWLIGDCEHDGRVEDDFRRAFSHLGSIEKPGDPDWDALARVTVQVPEEVGHAAE